MFFPRRLLPVVVFSFACGGEPPPIEMPPLHVTAKPPAPERARWSFAGPAQELRAKLDLGDGRTLYVGEHGRRELGKPGELSHATTLALESLAGVLRDGKRFVFVATDGDVYVSSEPLGALERVGKPRSEADALTSVTTGRAALVGIAANGTLMRSADYGATWATIDYSHGSKLVGGAAAVALDSKGNGILVHLPQRLFVTHDDGASWAPLASPPSGAVSAARDGADHVFVSGYQGHDVVLDGDKLVATKDRPTPIYTAASEVPDNEPPAARTILTGERAVQIALRARGTEKPSVDVRSTRFGEPFTQDWTSHPELVPNGPWNETMSRRIAASKGELVYLHTADPNDDTTSDDVKPITTTVLRSKDYGATWDKEDVFQGTFNANDEGLDVAIGSRGWMYVGPLCSGQVSRDCKPAKVRPAGKQAFEDLVPAAEPFAPIAFVTDEPRNKVYILAAHDGRKVVYELPLDGAKLARTTMLNALPTTDVAITVDGSGTLRTFERSDWKYWTVRKRNAKGEMQEPTFVPISGTLALVGPRGLSISEHDGWETNNGGDTWTRVPTNGATKKLMCGEAGCLLDDAQRIGWDLPALASPDVIRAQAKAPDEKAEKAVQTPPKTVPIKVACKESGATTPLGNVDWMDGSTLARWAQLELDTNFSHAVSLVWGSRDAVHHVSLMPPTTKAAAGDRTQVRTAQEERDNGMIAARYRFGPRTNAGYSQVNVELAWWSAVTGQVHRSVLPHVKPFRVSRYQFSGTARMVDGSAAGGTSHAPSDGGLVFRGEDSDVIYFIHDDGKVENLASPDIPFDDVWHSGKRWLVADSNGAMVTLADSEDGGKTWTQRSWGIARTRPTIRLEGMLDSMNGSPVVHARDWLFEVTSPLKDDPPVPIVIASGANDARCEGSPIGALRHIDRIDDGAAPPVSVEISHAKGAPEVLEAFTRVQHNTMSGALCSSVYALHEHDAGWGDAPEAYLYPEKGGGWSGWERRQSVVVPLTCK